MSRKKKAGTICHLSSEGVPRPCDQKASSTYGRRKQKNKGKGREGHPRIKGEKETLMGEEFFVKVALSPTYVHQQKEAVQAIEQKKTRKHQGGPS